jgi:hypothetical protein
VFLYGPLVVGSELVFEDRGIHRLRGLPEEIHLYAMRRRVNDAGVISLEIGCAHEQLREAHSAHA